MDDQPPGRLELSLRVLGNEVIGIQMMVDDMRMKWVIVGVAAIALTLWAAATFTPVLSTAF
jgi:hypothetical protein